MQTVRSLATWSPIRNEPRRYEAEKFFVNPHLPRRPLLQTLRNKDYVLLSRCKAA